MEKSYEKNIKQQFGSRLRSIRKKKGFSQEALALACELDQTYIGGVERGERNLSLINIHKIASALNISLGFRLFFYHFMVLFYKLDFSIL